MEALRGEFEAAWAQFQTLESLRLVPETLEAEWTRGRDTYLAFLVPIEDPAVAEHLRKLVRAVDGIPGVEPYPEDYWHITIKGVGFENANPNHQEDVSRSAVRSVAEAARDVFAHQPPFEARLGLAAAFPEVVFAEVWDAPPVPLEDVDLKVLQNLNGQSVEGVAQKLQNDGVSPEQVQTAVKRLAERGVLDLIS